eukprot:1158281-Pelagomonas_calceolata.AAC.8
MLAGRSACGPLHNPLLKVYSTCIAIDAEPKCSHRSMLPAGRRIGQLGKGNIFAVQRCSERLIPPRLSQKYTQEGKLHADTHQCRRGTDSHSHGGKSSTIPARQTAGQPHTNSRIEPELRK